MQHVLIIEDDKHFASQLKELIEFHGHEARTAFSGPEGIEAFRHAPADLLIVDVMLPSIHGLRVIEQIRTLPRGADAPVLLMSAVYRSERLFERDMKRLGVVAFLAKPFSLIDLGRKVQQILAEPEGGRAQVRNILSESAASAAGTGAGAGVRAAAAGTPAPAAPAARAPASSAGPVLAGASAPSGTRAAGAGASNAPGSGSSLRIPTVGSTGSIPAVASVAPGAGRSPAPTAPPAPSQPLPAGGGSAPGRRRDPSLDEIPAVLGESASAGDSFVPVDTARRLPPSGISSPVHYVQVMATLFHAHSSGRFTLHGQTARRTIYLLNGYPVWVSVSEPMEGLPRYLLEERLLDREGVAALDRWAAAHDGQVRGGLVEMGLMAAADLPPVMENWVAYEVRGALGHRGPYQFAPGDDFAGSIPVYEVNPIRAIWEGLAEHLAVDEVRRDLDALAGRSLGRTRTFNRLFGYVATSPALRELGESLLRPRTVQELRERFSDRDGQISRCLWFLVHAGLVALSDAPDLRRGETGTAAAVQPPGAGAGDAAESRVTGGMRAVAVDAPRPVEASRGADGPRVAAAAAPPAQAPPPPPPSWLEAAPTAPGMGAVPGGRTPSSSSMSSIQALPPGRSGLGVPAAEVEVAFETARYGRDAVERLRVAAAQRSGEAAKPGGPPEDPEASIVRDYVVRMDLDHYGFLGIPPNSSSEDVDAAYQSLAPRYRLRTLGAEVQGETRRKAKELLARLVAAYKELSDPERRKHYDALLARRAREERAPAALSSSTGSMRSVQDVEREVSGAAATVGADSDISPVLEGEIPAAGWYPGHGEAAALQRRVDKLGMLYGPLLREAHEAMEQGDWAQAHSRLEELRTRYPSDPGILTDLGWCRFAHSPTEARSIDKALEWVELALAFTPEHRGALEARARILMTTERHEDAVQALQRVRKLAPDAVWIQNAIEEREELLAAAAAAAAGGGREGGERGKGGGLLGGLLGRRKG